MNFDFYIYGFIIFMSAPYPSKGGNGAFIMFL